MYEVARLRIALADMPRPVLRRIDVPLSIRLDDLHLVLQSAMGWENRHPYEFRIGRTVTFSEVHIRRGTPAHFHDAKRSTLASILEVLGQQEEIFEYVYDFRDNWVHRVKLLSVSERDPDRAYPHLVGATRRCPPEDSGGAWGYGRFLESLLRHRRTPGSTLEGQWDEGFDPDTVDRELIRLHFASIAKRLDARDRARNR